MRNQAPPFTTTDARQVYASPWWRVEEHTVIDGAGLPAMYNVLHCGDGVSVLAVAANCDCFYLIREYKYAIGRHILQLPSGSVDDGEQPLQAAHRELLEEAGLTALAWTTLGMIYPYPTNIASAVYLFIAHDARPVREPESAVELLRLSRVEIHALIADNQITHAASLVCLLRYLASTEDQRRAGR